jgi:hypothetical protein
VLPQRAGQADPPVIYKDVEGTGFELAVEVDGLLGQWPQQAPELGRPSSHGDGVVGFRGGAHGFGLELTDEGWRAIAVCGTFTVDVQGVGEPPARLDLDALR